jgi:hypothetical protein
MVMETMLNIKIKHLIDLNKLINKLHHKDNHLDQGKCLDQDSNLELELDQIQNLDKDHLLKLLPGESHQLRGCPTSMKLTHLRNNNNNSMQSLLTILRRVKDQL